MIFLNEWNGEKHKFWIYVFIKISLPICPPSKASVKECTRIKYLEDINMFTTRLWSQLSLRKMPWWLRCFNFHGISPPVIADSKEAWWHHSIYLERDAQEQTPAHHCFPQSSSHNPHNNPFTLYSPNVLALSNFNNCTINWLFYFNCMEYLLNNWYLLNHILLKMFHV